MDRRRFAFLSGLAGAGALLPAPRARGDTGVCRVPPLPAPRNFRFDVAADVRFAAGQTLAQERPLWSALQQDEVRRKRVETALTTAYGRLMKRHWADKTSYLFQAWMHSWFCGGSAGIDLCPTDMHVNWQFLPWHRAFLYFHEKLMQEALNDSTFRLPVWDWEQNPTVPAVYNSLPPADPLAEACTRALAIPPVTQAQLAAWLQSKTFYDFAGQLNRPGLAAGSLHALVHHELGGYMSDFMSSAMDPLFFAHHANVDRFWDFWDHRYFFDEWPSVAMYFYQAGKPVRVNVRQLLTIKNMGYFYTPPQVTLGDFATVPAAVAGPRVTLDAGALSDLRKQLPAGSPAAPPVSIRLHMRISGLRHGQFYSVGIRDGGMVIPLRRSAGFYAAHDEWTGAVSAGHLDADTLAFVLSALSKGDGLQFVYEPAATGEEATPHKASGMEKDFTPLEFEFRIAKE